MQHILEGSECAPSIEIPYLYLAPYCHPRPWQGFIDFLFSEWHLPLDFLERDDGADFLTFLGSADQTSTYLQAWLFFGLVDECFGHQSRQWYTKDNSAGQLILSTTRLRRDIERWREIVLELADTERKQRLIHVVKCLRDSSHVMRSIWNSQSLRHQAGLYSGTALAIIALGQAVTSALPWVFGLSDTDRSMLSFDFGGSSFVRDLLVKNCWCINDFTRLTAAGISVSSLAIASSITRAASRKDHSECAATNCSADNIAEDTYSTQHLCGDSDCHCVGPDAREVEKAIISRSIPRIQVYPTTSTRQQGTTAEKALQVVQSGPYIAISHVWSDGLGNVSENKLPFCQISRLDRLITSIFESDRHRLDNGKSTLLDETALPAFWIDTLCVPFEKQLRHLAISMMKQVYEEAHFVVVLDNELQQISPGTSDEEIMIRILGSRWMRRVWTFQEGILAKRLLFLISGDQLFSCEDAIGFLHQRSQSGIAIQSLAKECTLFFDTFAHIKGTSDLVERFRIALTSYHYRTTSHVEDELLCFASLMGINTVQLFQVAPQDRMAVFLALQKDLPSEILFTEGPKRYATPFRWAPDTIMVDLPQSNSHASAVVTDQGLVLSRAGISLPCDQVSLWRASNATYHVQICYHSSITTVVAPEAFEYDRWYRPGHSTWQAGARAGAIRYAVLFQDTATESPWRKPEWEKFPVVLVSIMEEGNATSPIKAIYECRLVVRQTLLDKLRGFIESGTWGENLYLRNQSWCIQ